MTKKLPKATVETLDDIRREHGDAQPTAQAKATSRKSRPAAAKAPRESRSEVPPVSPAGDGAADTAAEMRRLRAGQIVERYTAYSAVGSIVPIPLVDTLSVVLLIVAMVRAVAKLYDVPFDRDRVRATVAGVIGGLGQAGVGSAVAASVAKLVPGAGMVGAAASSAVSALLTRTFGQAFILHFETGGTALEFDPATLRAHFEESPSTR